MFVPFNPLDCGLLLLPTPCFFFVQNPLSRAATLF